MREGKIVRKLLFQVAFWVSWSHLCACLKLFLKLTDLTSKFQLKQPKMPFAQQTEHWLFSQSHITPCLPPLQKKFK